MATYIGDTALHNANPNDGLDVAAFGDAVRLSPQREKAMIMLGTSSTAGANASISQRLFLPSPATSLSFVYKDVCPDTVTFDQFWVTLTDNTNQAQYSVVGNTCTNTGQWVTVNYGLAALAGHDVTLTFNHHDDNYAGDISYTYIDSVNVQ